MIKIKILIIYIYTFLSVFYASAQKDTLRSRLDTLERHLQLKEVTIYAPKKLFERKTDRLVFNVENSILSTGGDALEALRITPGVKVQDDQISMIAKSNMIVTIDDKIISLSGESLTNYLKSISTAGIKSIEIITTPPAKYDAEGSSGIVNIILKKNKIDSWNLNLRGSYKQATYGDGNLGADFNYKKNNLSIYTNITLDEGKTFYQMRNYIFYPTEIWTLTAPFHPTTKSLNANFGMDYKITNKWKIGVMYFGNLIDKPLVNTDIQTTINNMDNSVEETMNTTRSSKRNNNLNALNLSSIFDIDSLGKKISVDLDYFITNSRDSIGNQGNSLYPDNSIIPNSYYANVNRNEGKVTNYSAKIDVQLPLKWVNLNFGGKLSFSENNNDYLFYDNSTGNLILDNSQSNTFRYRESAQAIYISGNKQITGKLSTQLGLRVENTITEGYSQTLNQINNNNYLKPFPTLYLAYKLNEDRTISLNYSSRINRPSFSLLNPYKSYFNATDYNEGNPFLQPSFSNDAELSLTSKNIEQRIWYSYITGDILQFPFVDPATKIVRHYPINCINYYSTGLSETYTFNNFWWWYSNNNGVIYYIKKMGTIPESASEIHKISGNLTTNNDFMLNKKRTLMLNIGFYYEFPYLSGLGNVEANSNLYAGVKVRLLKDQLSISLIVNDIFKMYHAKAIEMSNNINYVYNNYGDTRYVRLSISYRIGNKLIKAEKRKEGNQDERGRVQ